MKVKIGMCDPHVKDKLMYFQSKWNLEHQDDKLVTIGEAVEKAIDEAMRIEKLENDLDGANKRIKELEDEIFNLNSDVYNLRTVRDTLGEFKDRMKGSRVNCVLRYIDSEPLVDECGNKELKD
jgi:predicted  nucleic acid-binding Zn-ribbon protein